jgi:hypothetical protein
MPTKVKKERDYRPHAEVLFSARMLIKMGEVHRENCSHLWLASLVLTAFAFEGYLNYLGRRLFRTWEDFERKLNWDMKASLIADRIDLTLDRGKPPLQTICELFHFRNNVAHLKPPLKPLVEEYETDNLDLSTFYRPIESKVEKFCTEANAKLCIEDVQKMMSIFYEHAKIGGEPTILGSQSGTASG